ncbi:DUF2789 domain-containing protein [Rheinheimera metallidurans]|uniref:DUF2789 domain-containing protein n=1 Tax=Rheinheimera metallidurans TaxID=2925781 RepID=UPI00300161B4
MEAPVHSIEALFKQLGLGGSSSEITHFVIQHSPLHHSVKLHEADFWTESQAYCLKKMLDEDADWAEIADQLNVLLR